MYINFYCVLLPVILNKFYHLHTSMLVNNINSTTRMISASVHDDLWNLLQTFRWRYYLGHSMTFLLLKLGFRLMLHFEIIYPRSIFFSAVLCSKNKCDLKTKPLLIYIVKENAILRNIISALQYYAFISFMGK